MVSAETMKTNTDTAICLKLLTEAGSKGIHSLELNRLVNTTRSAARINDLKKAGYAITSKPETLGNTRGVRYFLLNANVTTRYSQPRKPIRYEIVTDEQGYQWSKPVYL